MDDETKFNIELLKRKLLDSDYYILKSVEGYDIPNLEEIKAQRRAWRDRINELEKEE